MSKVPMKFEALLEVTEEEKKEIFSQLGITEDEFLELKKKAEEYIDQSEHLPKDYGSALLNSFVFDNKAKLERGKRCLDNYFRVKNDYRDCLFEHAVPGTKKFQECVKYTYGVCTKKLLPAPQCYRVQIYKLNDPDGLAEDAFTYMVLSLMLYELRGTSDYYSSTVIICDMTNLTLKNVLKFSAHWAFAVKDIMIYVHTSIEKLQQVIPKQCLPKDYGGYDKSIEELQSDWLEALEEAKPFFEKCRAARGTKKHEFNENQRESMGIGVDGSFKKLAID